MPILLATIALATQLQVADSAALAAERLFTVDQVIARGVAAGGFPGAAVAIGRHDGTVWLRGYGAEGCAGVGGTTIAVDPSRTVYDLASLTKVVATTTAIMVLYDQHRIRLDAPAARYLPKWTIGARAHVTIRDLLTHRSGLPAGRDLWRVAHSAAAARRAVLKTPLEYAPGDHYVYSDLGADVLGLVVEKISGESLDAFTREHVFSKLAMTSTRFRPPRSWTARLARTEAPLGRVHDRNAATLGGIAGHAGLFSSAADLAVFARMSTACASCATRPSRCLPGVRRGIAHWGGIPAGARAAGRSWARPRTATRGSRARASGSIRRATCS
jgi:CubicO group peptidase (beta-lactamase class C family)